MAAGRSGIFARGAARIGNLEVRRALTVAGVTIDENTLAVNALTATATELNQLHSVIAGTASASKAAVLGANRNLDVLALPVGGLKIGAGAGTALTPSAAEINRLTGIPSAAGLVLMQEGLITQTTGNGTYTLTLALPAGARIIDIGCDAHVLWNAGTSASLVVGDGDTADGFFTATNLNATDLVAGEINNIEHPGGKAGTYIALEQRNLYSASARNVIAVVTQVGAGTAGRTRIYVVYAVAGSVTAAVKV